MNKNNLPSEFEIKIEKNTIEYCHGVIYINGKQLDFLDKFQNSINDVIIALLKKIYKNND